MMDGCKRWGTPAHRTGCDHFWSPVMLKGILEVRWCLFCGTLTTVRQVG